MMKAYNFSCKIHGKYTGTSSRQICKTCFSIKEDFINKYCNCLENLDDFNIKMDISKDNISFKEIFIPNTVLSVIFWKCKNCRKWFIKNNKALNKMFRALDEDSSVYCSHFCSNNLNIKLRTGIGLCTACGEYSSSRDSVGHCNLCSSKLSKVRTLIHQDIGNCNKCGKLVDKRDLNGFCCECKPINDTLLKFGQYKTLKIECNKNCKDINICGFKNIEYKNIYGWCTKSSNFRYSNKEKLKDLLKNINISISFNEEIICLTDIINGSFDEVSGVWSLWSKDGLNCLTVGQSKNIGKELKWTLRVLANKKLQELGNKAGRWDKIQKFEAFLYKIIVTNEEDFNKREQIEAIYAIKNNAVYWNPSPTQASNSFRNKLLLTKEVE